MDRLNYLINMENFMYFCILGVVFNFLIALINGVTFKDLLAIKIVNKKFLVFVLIYGGIRSIFYIIFPFPYFAVISFIAEILLLKLISKEKIEKCIGTMAINFTLQVIIEIIFYYLFSKIFNIESYSCALYSIKYLICSYLCICVLMYFLYMVIKRKSLVLNVEDNFTKKDKNSLIISSMINSIIVYSGSIELLYNMHRLPVRMIIIYILSIAMCFYFLIQQALKIINSNATNVKISSLESYNKTLSIMYDNIRGFKHDFSNLVQALDGYAKTNDLDGIKQMTSSIINDCKGINNMEILNSSLIKNPAIHSIITSKYYLAQKENVEMNIEISTDLSDTNECSYEICRILAILLDNAIEAAKECDEKIVNLKCIMDPKVKRKLIIIENSYKQKDVDIDKIFEKGYTAKENSKNEHGLGLWTVRKTLNKLDNVNLFTTKGEHFCQQLEIYC